MAKSPDAFRTISEVADWLGVEAHVLRFWESRFTQVKPVKRAGGRRYYRPTDMALLGGIRKLLHEDGLTIRGVQKILREQGVGHVAAMSPVLALDEVELTAQARPQAPRVPLRVAEAPSLPLDLPPAARHPAPVAETSGAALPRRTEPAPVAERVSFRSEPAPPARPRPATDDLQGDALALLRRGVAADPERVGAVLARARDLLERLRSIPG